MRRLYIALGVLLVAVLGLGGWLWIAPCGMGGCAPIDELERFQAEGTQLFDRTGEPIGTLAVLNRRVVALDSLPDHLTRAVLAVEDRRFYSHSGLDFRRFAGAMVRNVRARGAEEGGSTITMQLARNLFPERLDYRDRSIGRKLREIRVARQIERSFEKDKILELYLNHIYLGSGAHGVDAAARTYFGTPAAELDLPQAALIAGLAQAPSRRNPRDNPEGARTRRDLVLREMAEAGYITADEAGRAAATPVTLAPATRESGQPGSYFTERVRRELEERVGPSVYSAGLRVHTTLDPAAQRAAEEEVSRQATAIEGGAFGAYRHAAYGSGAAADDARGSTYLQGAAVVMDASTGAVRALVGGRDFEDSQFDRIWQASRQPGSAFKPVVYLAALERRIPPNRRLEDAPVRIRMAGGRYWEPRNYTGRYDGEITMREALTRSKNTVTVRLAQEVGMSRVIATARQLGIESTITDLPSTSLGAAEVRPIELVRAYAALASGGWLPEPHLIERIEDRSGRVLYRAAPARERVVDPAAAFVLTTMLRDVVDRGTGTPVRAAGFRGPAAGKTGTTNGSTDAWFVGYTPELVAAVWFGFDRPATIVAGATGGRLAAPVWGRLMRRVYGGRSVPDFAVPRGVVTEIVDRATGYVIGEGCPAQGEAYTEYFVHVRPPRAVCHPDLGFPRMALDSEWEDAYAVPYEYESGDPPEDLRSRGIDWPELEERRRRGETRSGPIAGQVSGEDAAPVDTARPAPGRSPGIRDRVAPTTGREESDPPEPTRRPERREPQEPAPRPERREPPEVLGRPVDGAGATPPDTTSRGG
jgi:1A family penicillin-binding protein